MRIGDYLARYEVEDPIRKWLDSYRDNLAEIETILASPPSRKQPGPKRIPPWCRRACMLEWKLDKAHELAGPFEGGYALCVLNDHTHQKALGNALLGHGDTDGGEHPSHERPFAVRVYGNDDSSWSKFYPTFDAASSDMNILENGGQLEVSDLYSMGFVFTN